MCSLKTATTAFNENEIIYFGTWDTVPPAFSARFYEAGNDCAIDNRTATD